MNIFSYYNADVGNGPLNREDEMVTIVPSFAFHMAKSYINNEPDKEKAKKLVKQYLPAISKSAKYSFRYARYVIGDKFPEGEDAISKNALYACQYADRIIRGVWEKGEKAIMQDPEFALEYAGNVLKRRWPEAEKYIAQDEEFANQYNDMFGTNL